MKSQNKKNVAGLPKAAPMAPVKTKRNLKPLVIVLAVLLVVGGLLGFRHWRNEVRLEQAYKADKARFAQVEADMAVAYAAMIAGDKPIHEKLYKNCEYPSVEFSFTKGTPTCKTGFYFKFESSSYSMLAQKMLDFESRVQGINSFQVTEKSDIREPRTDAEIGLIESRRVHAQVAWKKYQNLCSIEFNAESPTENGDSTESNIYIGNFNFQCRQEMKRPIYTLVK